MMKAELKKAWVEDLRRDDIKQCMGVLQDSGGANCCLGRLYIVAGVEPEHDEVYGVQFNGQDKYPSHEDLEEWGLTDKYARDLYRKNDGVSVSEPWTFKQIADYIENNPVI